MIAAKINYPLEKIRYSENIYEFSEDALISVIKQIDDSVNKAMVVGHNPATNGLPIILVTSRSAIFQPAAYLRRIRYFIMGKS